MRIRIAIAALLVFILASTLAAPVFAGIQLEEQSSVRVVMFWSQGCPHCHEVLENVFPALQEKYGRQLEILLIEVSGLDEIEQLYQLAESLDISRESVFVPFVIIGRKVLIGSNQIPAQLPGLIDDHLAEGGSDYPDIPLLAQLLPLGVMFSAYQSAGLQPLIPQQAQEPQESAFSGMTLAAVIIVFMLIAIVIVVIVFLRTYQGKPAPSISRWQDMAIPALSILGLGVAAYLSYVEASNTYAICGPIGDCNAVQTSPYAKLFGVLPVGVLGGIGYIAILSSWLLKRIGSGWISDTAPLGLFGMSFFGTLYSIYLTYLELFVIEAACLWCLSSAVIITLLMLLSLGPAAAWIAEGDEET